MQFPYKKLVCDPWGKVGSSKGERERERERRADERKSVPNTEHLTTGCLKQPAPFTQQSGRQATDRPSTLLLMTLGFQEPAAALTPIRPGV